jgi:hypothetical protein
MEQATLEQQRPAGRIHEEQRSAIVSQIPRWYRPGVHLAIPTVFGLAVMIAAASQLRGVTLTDALAVPLTLLFGFAFEWRAHKSILHAKQPLLGLLYERHELMHHVVFTYDDITMRSGRELWLILMPAYAIVLVFAMVLPAAGLTAVLATTNAALLLLVTAMAFFLAYEWLHMAYHLPKESFVGRLSIIAALREHHRRHHDPRLMKRWNFNVTLPLFDWIHRTAWSAGRARARAAGAPPPASAPTLQRTR